LRMPLGRTLSRQVEQPHKLARMLSLLFPANQLGGASTRTCAMLSAPLGCFVFDIDRVGTYRGRASVIVDFAIRYTRTYPQSHAASGHRRKRQKRSPSVRPLFLTSPCRRRYLPSELETVRRRLRPPATSASCPVLLPT
jgi:hypothetical protein